MKVYDTLIIGGGPAGYSAALYSARAGLDTLVLERASIGGQMALTDVIDNYPGFDEGIDGFTLGMKMQSGAERFGARTEYAEVVGVSFLENPKRVETSLGEYLSRSVIIATGAVPRMLGVLGEEEHYGRGVHYCAHCDGRFYKDKTVAVVGGGGAAAENALYLSRLCKKVYLIHRRDSLRAEKIYRDALENSENVEFIRNSRIRELRFDTKVRGVILESLTDGSTDELAVDGIFVSIGMNPASDLFRNELSLDPDGYIIAGEDTKTSVDGVFAVGDVRTKPIRQVVGAVSDGATAAHFAEEYLNRV